VESLPIEFGGDFSVWTEINGLWAIVNVKTIFHE